ncbi:hypothetical protein SCUP234_05702 [Seiridium cupressi]
MKQTVPKVNEHHAINVVHEGDQHPPTPIEEDMRQEPLLRPSDEKPAKPRLFNDSSTNTSKGRERFSSSWWWWEIGGAILALIGLFMTIAVLATLDNKPVDDWKYNIQPSSLLSTLTTVGKTGVMLVLGSCVSQLKWLHFQQPNRLSHLKIYDDVSRASPVGAAQMFWKIGCRPFKLRLDIVATAFALVSLLSLAIDPMIQQILGVQQQDLQLKNVTAAVGSSRAYISNVSFDIAADNFSNDVDLKGVNNYRNLTVNFGGDQGATFDWFRSVLDIIQLEGVEDGGPFDIARMFFIRVNDGVENDLFLRNTSLPVPTAQIAMANWYWCAQTYDHISMQDGKLTGMTTASTDPLIPGEISTDNGAVWSFYGHKPDDQDYYSNFLVSEFMDHFFLLDTKNPHLLNASSLGALHPQVYKGGQPGQDNSSLEGYTDDLFGMANFMSYANWGEITQNVATAITNEVLTNGDNLNFTDTNGTAFVNTVYYHVQWPWLVLPLLEAVATVALLAVTIWLNRLPVLKSSSTAMMVHGLEDISDLKIAGIETTDKWERVGDGMKVKWQEDEQGWTRLTRA